MRNKLQRLIPALYCVIACTTLLAQNEGQLQSDFRREGAEITKDCTAVKTIFGCLQTLVTGQPVHFTAGSLAPQNGVGFGGAFVFDKNYGESWRTSTNADAVVSTNGSWRAGAYLKLIRTPTQTPTPVVITTRPAPGTAPQAPELKPAPEFNVYVQAISLNKVDYYGLGPFTSRQSLASFGMTEIITGGNVTYPVFGGSGLALYGELNGRWVDIRGRHGDSIPSIEQLYSNATAPGLAQQPAFFQPAEGVKFVRGFSDRLKLNYSATMQEFVAVSDSQYSFGRLNLDFTHDIPLYRNQRSIPPRPNVGPDESPDVLVNPQRFTRNREGSVGLRALWVQSFIPSGNVVPFYFQPTMGGADIVGEKMLASFPDYRFRAPNLLLFRASIEHSIWGPVGAMFMADTGRVALTHGDLGFDHFRHSYAAGLTLRAGGFPMVQLLFAWGGGEGTHIFANINPSILGGGARPSLY
jgi:hypothetical protein